jgi:hypothetical protein
MKEDYSPAELTPAGRPGTRASSSAPNHRCGQATSGRYEPSCRSGAKNATSHERHKAGNAKFWGKPACMLCLAYSHLRTFSRRVDFARIEDLAWYTKLIHSRLEPPTKSRENTGFLP